METSYTKGSRDGWKAVTEIPLTQYATVTEKCYGDVPGRTFTRVLRISTFKASNGQLISSANVHETGNGMLRMSLGGDFSKRLVTSGVRCTEQAVRAQHENALAVAPAVLAEAHAFYAAKDAEKVPA
jgi:hypothetical protein